MWEALGVVGLIVLVGSAAWFLVRLLKSAQGRDRSHEANDSLTPDEAPSYEHLPGSGGPSAPE